MYKIYYKTSEDLNINWQEVNRNYYKKEEVSKALGELWSIFDINFKTIMFKIQETE